MTKGRNMEPEQSKPTCTLRKGDLVKFAEIGDVNPSSHFEWIAQKLQPMRVIRVCKINHNGSGQLVTVRVGRWPGGIVLKDYDPLWFELVSTNSK